MKLINFDEIFKPVIRKLEINNLKDFRSEVFIDTPKWKNMIEKGQEIDINKDLCIYDDGTIGLEKEKSKKRRVILYIMNQNYNKSTKREYKYHIGWCTTLEEMRKNKRLNRYVAIRKKEPYFKVAIYDMDTHKTTEIENKKMSVCKNCLKKLNYKGYKNLTSLKKEQIYQEFNLKKFLEEYKFFGEILIQPKNIFENKHNEYSEDWKEISRKLRKNHHWICEKCGKNFENQKGNLVVHHIDGNKQNNSAYNLKVLCKECHALEPNHEHLKRKNKVK